jgi:hypothetical protein
VLVAVIEAGRIAVEESERSAGGGLAARGVVR